MTRPMNRRAADRSRIEVSLRVDEAARSAAPLYDADRRFIPGPNGPLRLDRGQPYRG
jgi:hypothetical protein